MQDDTLLPRLEERTRNSAPAEAKRYRALAEAIRKLPSDAEPSSTSRQRALASIPWAPGKDPFVRTAEDRKILAE